MIKILPKCKIPINKSIFKTPFSVPLFVLTCSMTIKYSSWCVMAYCDVPFDVIKSQHSGVTVHRGTSLATQKQSLNQTWLSINNLSTSPKRTETTQHVGKMANQVQRVDNQFWLIYWASWILIAPFKKSSLMWRRHHCRWNAAKLSLRSTLMAFEQEGVTTVPCHFCIKY